MKIFANKNIWKKIIIIFLLISTLSFAAPKPVAAGIGGELMEPVCELLVGIGDGIIKILHSLFIQQDMTLIRVDLNLGIIGFFKIIATVVAFVVVLAAIGIATGGIGAVIALIAKGTAVTSITLAAVLGEITLASLATIGPVIPLAIGGGAYAATKVYNADAWDNEVDLPMYSLSPEEIFTNNIPLFSVNFINPSGKTIPYSWATKIIINKELTDAFSKATEKYDSKTKQEIDEILKDESLSTDTLINMGTQDGDSNTYYYTTAEKTYRITKIETDVASDGNYLYHLHIINSPASTSAEGEIFGFSYQLSKIVSNWYFALRMIAIVGMMSVLVYIGIRILLSSTSSSQKAKYKQLLGDWLVGMVLLFTMHYIMALANIFVDNLTGLMSQVNPSMHAVIIEEKNGKIKDALQKVGINTTTDENASNNRNVYEYEENGHTYYEWHTNLMGHIRVKLRENAKNDDAYVGYTIMFIVMIFYLLFFCWTYIKRVIYMAFLTLIAPLVALTYPIDKANDGKAQGFDYWFKEYIFNLLLQPMHLLIYTILIASAIELAATNWIYSLVAMGFIASAEKIVRQMFNFSKAHTPGAFSGAAGAALAFSGMRWLFGHGPKGDGGKGPKGISGKDSAGRDASGKEITAAGKRFNAEKGMEGLFRDSNVEKKSKVPDKNTKGTGGARDTSNTPKPEEDKRNFYEVYPHEDENDDYIDYMMQRNDNKQLARNGYSDEDIGNAWESWIENNPAEGGMPLAGNGYSDEDIGNAWESWIDSNPAEDGMPLATNGYSDEDIGNAWESYINDNSDSNEPELEGIKLPERERMLLDRIRRKGYDDKIMNNEITPEEFLAKHERSVGLRLAARDAFGAYKDGMKAKFVRNLENAEPVKKLGKLAAGAAGAAAFGTVGLAAGVASGDFGKAAQYTAASAAGGYKLSSGAYGHVAGDLHVDGVGDAAERAYLGEEKYKEKQARINQEKRAKDENVIKTIQEKMKVSREEAKKYAKEWAPKYMDKNINDVNDWINLEKMQEKEFKKADGTTRKYSLDEACSVHFAHKRSGFESKDKEKATKKLQSDYNLDEEQAKVLYGAVKVYDDIKNG